MSVAIEFAPVVEIPAHARLRADHYADLRPAGRLGAVIVLRPPSERSAPSLRLTRRGVIAMSAAVVVLAAALVATARLSAPSAAAGSPAGPVPAAVTVRPGDSLWSIAERVAPATDPRAEVAALARVNHLRDPALFPGQLLRTG
ncbi:MAG: LysM peptidoglycan-binding domain-containing protein [Actinomycetota bacterium]|nr:LysM peptidoglycan-binding domain-containing protein [Actinomycetota bacterium]